MSRTAARYNMIVTRGATWEDEFTYTADDGVTPINLTGYSARMHVRTLGGQYGLTTTTTLMLELTTVNGLLVWDTAPLGKLRVTCSPANHAMLNPLNLRKSVYTFSIEVYLGTYVLPLVEGKLTVRGEVTR